MWMRCLRLARICFFYFVMLTRLYLKSFFPKSCQFHGVVTDSTGITLTTSFDIKMICEKARQLNQAPFYQDALLSEQSRSDVAKNVATYWALKSIKNVDISPKRKEEESCHFICEIWLDPKLPIPNIINYIHIEFYFQTITTNKTKLYPHLHKDQNRLTI